MGLYPPHASPVVECHLRGQLLTAMNLLETSLCVKVISSRTVCQSLLSSTKGAERDSEFVSVSEVLFWLPTSSHAQLLSKFICILAPQKTADLMEQVREKKQDKVIFSVLPVWKCFQFHLWKCSNLPALLFFPLFLATDHRHQRRKIYAGSNTDFICLSMKYFSHKSPFNYN